MTPQEVVYKHLKKFTNDIEGEFTHADIELFTDIAIDYHEIQSSQDKERIAELTAEVERLKEMMIEKNNIIR